MTVQNAQSAQSDPASGSSGRTGWLLAGIASACVALILSVGAVRSWLEEREAALAERPTLEGRIEVAGLSEPAEIWRDEAGWPHIVAANEADGWLALGFVHAQDRLRQMLWLRRLARGLAAEQIGEAGLDADRLTRIVGLARIAESEASHLTPEVAAILDAYSRGVNARLERLRPGEEPAPGVSSSAEPPWTAVDCIAVYKLVTWSSGHSIDVAIVLSDLIQRLGGVGARPFFPTPGAVQGVGLPVDWPSGEEAGDEARRSEPLRPALLDVARLDATAWVWPSGGPSAAPTLAAQLTFGTHAPALVHPAHLVAGELAVAGAAIPGVPVFWVGRSREVSWAASPARAVVTDLFVETLRPNDGRAYHDGVRWTGLDECEESIPVRGREAEQLVVRSTHHGPLISDLLSPDREPLAVAWTGARPGSGPAALMGLVGAGSADEIEERIARHRDPAVHLAYADRKGARGARVAGWMPRRILPSSGVPVPGRMRAFNWYEPVPSEDLPARRQDGRVRAGSPPILAADDPLSPGRGTAVVEWLWRRGVRADRLAQRLAGRDGEVRGLDDAAAWFEDERQAGTREVVQAIRALAPQGPSLGAGPSEILEVLDAWDGRFAEDSAGASVYRTLLAQLVHEIFAPALGDDLLDRYTRLPGADPQWVAAAILVAAAESDAPGSWADRSRVGPALADALRETWMTVRYRLGPNRSRWAWGRIHGIRFLSFTRPDLLETAPGLPDGAVPVGGSRHTVLRTESLGRAVEVQRFAGYRWLADLGRDLDEPDAFRAALAPGVPEQPDLPAYAAGFEVWETGRMRAWPGASELEADREAKRLSLAPPP